MLNLSYISISYSMSLEVQAYWRLFFNRRIESSYLLYLLLLFWIPMKAFCILIGLNLYLVLIILPPTVITDDPNLVEEE
jgi:hypothetical protein